MTWIKPNLILAVEDSIEKSIRRGLRVSWRYTKVISEFDFFERGLLREIEPMIRVAARGSEYKIERQR